MDQNNINNQNNNAAEDSEQYFTLDNQAQGNSDASGREPLPTFDFSVQQPAFVQDADPSSDCQREIDSLSGPAFGQALASVILAWYPIGSLIALILGSSALKKVRRANELAERYGVSAGGKIIAAKIMGKIGKISGIVLTIFYSLYILLLIAIVGAAI